MSLTLYYHPLSSFCWKVLIALYETETEFLPHVVDLADPAARAAFVRRWPIGKFPVLHDAAQDQLVPESTIIIEYLAQHYPGRTQLLPRDPDQARETRLQDRLFDTYVHQQMQKIVGDRLRPAGQSDPTGVEAARTQIEAAFHLIEVRMATRTWAMGDAFTLADCAALPALYYATIAVPLASEHSNVRAYLARLEARPTIARVLREAEPYFQYYPLNEERLRARGQPAG